MILKRIFLTGFACCLLFAFKSDPGTPMPRLKISANHRYFTAGGKPFFWLGDTGWLMFSKLKREEAELYLETRRKQGFNVIQAMVVHEIFETNIYGDSALVNKKIIAPRVTPGNTFGKGKEYDYWDHIDWIIKLAQSKGIYIAMVPVWGSVVKETHMNAAQGAAYAAFLAKRYGGYTNIIWMNGGDILGTDSIKTWKAIGSTIRKTDPNTIMTFHPRGRTQSSTWFHHQQWLDFNGFQSGHRNYAQDTSKKDLQYGEDNWRYAEVDYKKTPTKPTLDIEPIYEKIPYGLHDTLLPRWSAPDLRRYAYWSVFAGGCGFTYGNNDVMQMHKPADRGKNVSYGSKDYWYKSINDPGANQMVWLKKLILSRPYAERVPDQSLVAADQGERYNRLLATRGKNYAFVYAYNGREMLIDASKLTGSKVKASWYDPRSGKTTDIGTFAKSKALKFNPPGDQKDGNDWVLVLDSI